MKSRNKEPTILLLTGLGMNYRLLYPYKRICNTYGWQCEIVENSSFSTDDIDEYSRKFASLVDKYENTIAIGISLGGLAIINALANHPSIAGKIQRVYTICSPVKGIHEDIMSLSLSKKIMSGEWPDLFKLKKLGKTFLEKKIYNKISLMKEDISSTSIYSYFHENDHIVPPEKSFLDNSVKRRIKYKYPLIPKVFHHHAACSDPRIFLEILNEINSDY